MRGGSCSNEQRAADADGVERQLARVVRHQQHAPARDVGDAVRLDAKVGAVEEAGDQRRDLGLVAVEAERIVAVLVLPGRQRLELGAKGGIELGVDPGLDARFEPCRGAHERRSLFRSRVVVHASRCRVGRRAAGHRGGGARAGRRLVRRARAADARRHPRPSRAATCRRSVTRRARARGRRRGHAASRPRRGPRCRRAGGRRARRPPSTTAASQPAASPKETAAARRRKSARGGVRRPRRAARSRRRGQRRPRASATSAPEQPGRRSRTRETSRSHDSPTVTPSSRSSAFHNSAESVPYAEHHPPAQARHAGGDEEEAAQRRDEAVDRDVEPAVAGEAGDERVDLRAHSAPAGRASSAPRCAPSQRPKA